MAESSSAAETTNMVSGLPFRRSATTHGIPWRQGFTLAELLVSVGDTDAYAQYVHPKTFLSTALPGSSDEWQMTRVDYYASKAKSADGSTYEFEIDKATADGLSTHDGLYSVTLDPDDASGSGGWLSVSMDGCPGLMRLKVSH